jgi:tripartite-type tricarboxylate transporter receptor subunit TctC
VNFLRREVLRFAGACLAAPAVSRLSWAQTWPTRPIRAIVPILPGSAIDILSRLVLKEVSILLGQPIVIENRPGVGGTIGAAAVAKADADGHTILIDSSSFTIAPSLYSHLPYDPVQDFSPVIPLGSMPLVLVCAPTKPFKTVQELVSAAKVKPGDLSYASGGVGTSNHLAAERFRLSAGFQALHVPFRGAGYAADLMSGRVDFAFVPLAPSIPRFQDGRLLALAVASRKRAALLPTTPTTLETGYANSETDFWVGMFAPAKTPRGIVERLNQETIKVLGAASLQESFANNAAEPMIMSPTEFETMIRGEVAANAALAKSIGLTAS